MMHGTIKLKKNYTTWRNVHENTKRQKVNLSLSRPWRHYRGSRGVALLILNLSSKCMVSITPRPLYSRICPSVPIHLRGELATAPVWTDMEKSSKPCRYSNPDYREVAVPNTLFNLPTTKSV